MSHSPLLAIEESSKESDNAIALHHHLAEYPHFAAHYISSVFGRVQELKMELNDDRQHEKHVLIHMNERLRIFVSKVHQLEGQNSRYLVKLAHIREHVSNMSVFGTKWNERYRHLQIDLMTVNCENIDYEFELELFHMQSEIFQQLIHTVNQMNDEQHVKLQQDLDLSSSTLSTLRASYKEVQREIEGLHAERKSTLQQYLKIVDSWGHWKKQIGELKIIVQTLKSQHAFFKDLCSSVSSEFSSMEVFDAKAYWAMQWEKLIANIRHDYELLYSLMNKETITYYEKKVREVEEELKQAKSEQTHYDYQIEMKKLEMVQKISKLHIEEAHKTWVHEKEVLKKLEAMNSKLESQFESIKHHHGERFEQQSKDLHILQENVTAIDDNIEEMRRKKMNLESELIIYRRLLELDVEQIKTVEDSPSLVRSITMRKFIAERKEVASIGIECPLDNTYVCLVNHSTNKDIDISRWILKRRVVSKPELKYTLPNGTRLPAGGELKIYSKSGAEIAQVSSNYDIASHSLRQKIVTHNIISWGTGDKIETLLLDEYGDEKASCVQTAAIEDTIPD